MAFSLQAVVRPNIWELEAYRCARDDYTEGVLLDANENSLGPPVADNSMVYERYPCPYQVELKTLVADYRGVKNENVFVGVGSDEAIDMLIRIFCVPGKDKVNRSHHLAPHSLNPALRPRLPGRGSPA